MYRNQSYDINDSVRHSKPDYRIEKTFHIDKVVESLVLRFGKRFVFTDHLYMNLSGGIGIRAKIANRSGLDEGEYPLLNDGFIRDAMYVDTQGQFFTPDIRFCVKLGYMF